MRARWRWLLALALIFGAYSAVSGSTTSTSHTAEQTYLAEMHAAGLYDDQESREFAQAMCLATTVTEAEATILQVLDQHPNAGHVFGVAAGFGVRAYCPDKADLWVEAGERLAATS
ncbi:MAG TPA: hypothetical protein VIT65_22390 [Microlunatus sp.]